MKRLLVLLSFVATVTAWATQASAQAPPPIIQEKQPVLFPKPASHSGPAPIADLEPAPQTSASTMSSSIKAIDRQASQLQVQLLQQRMKRDEAVRWQFGGVTSVGVDPGEGYPAVQKIPIFQETLMRQAIPTNEVHAIVLGDVLDAHAFVPSHRAGIYSEFSVKVSEVLMQSSAHPISVNQTVDLIRGGGAVRFPSGRIHEYWFNHDGYPNVGSSYLFFMWLNPESDTFEIYSGYELRDGKVLVLDQEPQFEKYEGADEVSFLTLVRQKIADTKKVGGLK